MSTVHLGRRGFLAVSGLAAAGSLGVLVGARARAAGAAELRVGPVRRVGPEGAKYFEPWIAANPRDAANLVVVGSSYLGEMANRAGERMEPAAWFTVDGGATWSAGAFAGNDRLRAGLASFADAYATYAPNGTAFCVFLGSPDGKGIDQLSLSPTTLRIPPRKGLAGTSGTAGPTSPSRVMARHFTRYDASCEATLNFDASIYRTELIGRWSVSRSDVFALSRHFSFIAIGLINILSTSI